MHKFALMGWVCLAAASAQPVVWTAPSLQRVGLTDAPGSNTEADVFAARGEYESYQIVVHAPGGGLSDVKVTVSSLAGPGGATIPVGNLVLFREKYVHVSASSPNRHGSNQPLGPGWYADGLIPFNDPDTGADLSVSGASIRAEPFSVAGGQNQPIWVDILVPRGAAAGRYSGSFAVTSDQGNASGTVVLEVWNFTLPVQPSLKSTFPLWSSNTLAVQKELLRNRISTPMVAVGDEQMLVSQWGLNARNLNFFSGAYNGHCVMGPPPSVSALRAADTGHPAGLAIYSWTADEVENCPALYPTIRDWATTLHAVGVKNLVTMPPHPELFSDNSGSGRSAVDIWAMLPFQYDLHKADVARAIAKGDEAWSYNCLVQDSYSPKWLIDYPPIDFRVQPGFINQSLNITGMLYWRADLPLNDPWNTADQFWSNGGNYPGDGMVVYPGQPVGIAGAAPSMRLKWLRDGVDDYEYIQILRDLGQASFAVQVANSVGPDWTNWTRDPAALEYAREELGHEIDMLKGGSSPPPRKP